MACFRCNTTEIFIFSLKYCQRKVNLNTSKKSLVFVTLRQNISSLRQAIIYEKFIFTRKYALVERCYFLNFRLKESSENMIYPWNGNTRKQTNLWSFLHFPQIFVRRKFFFSCSVLMANIFKFDKYQTFGLMKMHNMSKIWFASNKFSLWYSSIDS